MKTVPWSVTRNAYSTKNMETFAAQKCEEGVQSLIVMTTCNVVTEIEKVAPIYTRKKPERKHMFYLSIMIIYVLSYATSHIKHGDDRTDCSEGSLFAASICLKSNIDKNERGTCFISRQFSSTTSRLILIRSH